MGNSEDGKETPSMPMVQLAQVVVTLKPDGGVNVTGPLENATLCYGMLEHAKMAIHMHVEKMNKPRIIPVRGSKSIIHRGEN